MSDLSLQRFDKDGIELIIDTNTGESFASVKGYARMSGLTTQAISARLKGVKENLWRVAEIPTAGGLQGVKLIYEDLIAEWIPKDNPILSTQLFKLGIRGFMHKLAGFEIASSAVIPPVREYHPSKALLASREVKEIHENTEDISPRLKQFLIDCCINEVIDEKYLRPADEPKLRGVVEIAQDMGHKVDHSNRSQLGRFVKSVLPHLAQAEKRLCNGTEREIAVYPDTDEVRQCITKYFT